MLVPRTRPTETSGQGAPHRRHRTSRGAAVGRTLAVAVLAALVGLAGCASSSDSASTAAGVPAPAAAADGGADGGAQDEAAAPAARVAAAAAPRLVRTAEVVLEVGDLRAAAAKVRATAESLEGTVTSEVTSSGSPVPEAAEDGDAAGEAPGDDTAGIRAPSAVGPGRSILVVRVPEPRLGAALDRLSGPTGVGRELSRSASTRDVTGDLADLESRVTTQRASVARVRELLDRAGSLKDVVLLEGELARREADLEALQARRTALADRAELATLTVDLRTAEAVQETEESAGLVAGLRSGWDAVGTSTRVVLTVVGALLPFAVLAAVVGGPILWLTRRRRRRAAPPVSPPAGPLAPQGGQPVPAAAGVGAGAADPGPAAR